MLAGPDWFDRPGRGRLRRRFSAGGGPPPATRAAHLVNTFFVVDINVLRLRLATAESTA